MSATKFKRVKSHTIPFISAVNEGDSIFVKITEPMRASDYIPDGQKAEMIICPAINLETGEECNLIVGTVLNKIFTSTADYVGKAWEIQNQGKAGRGSTKYTKLGVWEIEA